MNNYLNIFWSRTGVLFLVGVVLILLPYHWGHLIAFVLIFNSFDVWGFRDVDGGRGTEQYRVIQFVFQVAFMRVIYLMDGGPTTIACLIAWLSLACDVLYYWTVERELEPFTWFILSPVNFVYNKLFKEATPIWAVLTSAFIGVVCGLLITFVER